MVDWRTNRLTRKVFRVIPRTKHVTLPMSEEAYRLLGSRGYKGLKEVYVNPDVPGTPIPEEPRYIDGVRIVYDKMDTGEVFYRLTAPDGRSFIVPREELDVDYGATREDVLEQIAGDFENQWLAREGEHDGFNLEEVESLE